MGFTDTLKKGDRIELRGFGSFTVKEYGAYTGRNPKTGKNTEVGRKKLPFFKVGNEVLINTHSNNGCLSKRRKA